MSQFELLFQRDSFGFAEDSPGSLHMEMSAVTN